MQCESSYVMGIGEDYVAPKTNHNWRRKSVEDLILIQQGFAKIPIYGPSGFVKQTLMVKDLLICC